jgi:hypothetical protein
MPDGRRRDGKKEKFLRNKGLRGGKEGTTLKSELGKVLVSWTIRPWPRLNLKTSHELRCLILWAIQKKNVAQWGSS